MCRTVTDLMTKLYSIVTMQEFYSAVQENPFFFFSILRFFFFFSGPGIKSTMALV